MPDPAAIAAPTPGRRGRAAPGSGRVPGSARPGSASTGLRLVPAPGRRRRRAEPAARVGIAGTAGGRVLRDLFGSGSPGSEGGCPARRSAHPTESPGARRPRIPQRGTIATMDPLAQAAPRAPRPAHPARRPAGAAGRDDRRRDHARVPGPVRGGAPLHRRASCCRTWRRSRRRSTASSSGSWRGATRWRRCAASTPSCGA